MKIIPNTMKPGSFILMNSETMIAAGSLEHCEKYQQFQVEKFSDDSEILTDRQTGNRTVIGKLAHDEYFKRLRAEKIFTDTPCAVIDFCVDLDGTRINDLST